MIVSDDDTDPAVIERQVREALAAERVTDRQNASAFAASCRTGDVDAMLRAADFLNDRTIDGWRLSRLIHLGLADAVFWADGARDRASTVTRMDPECWVGA